MSVWLFVKSVVAHAHAKKTPVACHKDGAKKKSESLTGFEPMTSQTPGGLSIHLSYGELMESEAIY